MHQTNEITNPYNFLLQKRICNKLNQHPSELCIACQRTLKTLTDTKIDDRNKQSADSFQDTT